MALRELQLPHLSFSNETITGLGNAKNECIEVLVE
jgi:hypothetical protein